MKGALLQTAYLCRCPSWWLGAMLSFAAMMQGLFGEGVRHGSNLVYMTVCAMNFGVFIPLAPLAAILAVCMHLESEMRRACVYSHLLRQGKRRFVLEAGVSAAIAGGLALALGWAASLLLVRAVGRAPLTGENMLGMEQTPLGGLLLGDWAGLYIPARMLLVFFYGAFCVCCAMPAAMWRQEAAVICLIPFVALRVMQYLFSSRLPVLLSPTWMLLGFGVSGQAPGIALIAPVLSLTALGGGLLALSVWLFGRRLGLD